MPALAAVTVSATPHAPGGRDCPPRHLPDAPRELGLVAVSRHLKYSALCATVVSRDFNPTSTPSPRHTPSTRRPLPAGEDDALGPLLGPLCCSSELRRLGDAAVAHVRPDRSIGGCSGAAPAPRVFSKGPLPHQHAIDATHFEARLAAPSRLSIPLDAVEGHGCGLGRFAHLDVRRGLRRTRAGARVGNAPVA